MDPLKSETNSPILSVDKLSVSFGRLDAVSELEFSIKPMETFGLIGPNGAGKTTVFNAITGTVPIKMGRIFFQDIDITGMKPHHIAKFGIARTHQSSTIFPHTPVEEHIMIGFHCRTRANVFSCLLKTPFSKREEVQTQQMAHKLMTIAKLKDVHKHPAESLTWAQQRRLMVATALATRPKLILLDEPVAGMNAEEIQDMLHLISAMKEEGITVFIIEHNMRVIMRICDRIVVLNYGRKIAEGKPEEIAHDRRVIEAYLGEEE